MFHRLIFSQGVILVRAEQFFLSTICGTSFSVSESSSTPRSQPDQFARVDVDAPVLISGKDYVSWK